MVKKGWGLPIVFQSSAQNNRLGLFRGIQGQVNKRGKMWSELLFFQPSEPKSGSRIVWSTALQPRLEHLRTSKRDLAQETLPAITPPCFPPPSTRPSYNWKASEPANPRRGKNGNNRRPAAAAAEFHCRGRQDHPNHVGRLVRGSASLDGHPPRLYPPGSYRRAH
jgi:hypothetical protein